MLYVHQITSPLLNKWMGTWKSKTYWSKSKKRDNTIAFFDHCIAQKWIRATLDKDRGNPARGMAKIVGRKDSSIPTLPFTPAQFQAVLRACTVYDLSLATVNKAEVRGKGKRLHALCNLMRWSGLAITDAVTLQRSRLGRDNRLVLYRSKTGNLVTVLLPVHISQMNCAMSRMDLMHTLTISFGQAKANGTRPPAHGKRRYAVCGRW